MISKSNRFHGRNSLNPVYRHGQAFSLSELSLKSLPTRVGNRPRLAVVVSRKVSKSAVVRNRVRRRVYEYIRLKFDGLSLSSDIVISVYSEKLATMSPKELDSLLNEILVKAKLLTSVKDDSRDIVDGKREPS